METATPTPAPVVIYNGIRGDQFKNMLRTILKRGALADGMIDQLLDDEGIKMYSTAFTHPTADTQNNYEYMEFLGDSMVNTAIVWYISRRFRHLQGVNGVKVLARLKINLVSKKSFADCAKKLNIWDYISCSDTTRKTIKKKVLEDVFEAFFGATTLLMDSKVCMSSGYAVVYAIIESLFDEMHISLKYEDLFDARTRIKEIFDCNRHLGELVYTTDKEMVAPVPNSGGITSAVFTTRVSLVPHGPTPRPVFLGKGTGNTKVDSVQVASEAGIHVLKTMGIQTIVKPEYLNLS